MFPERLKQLRKERGMTQLDLAAALNVSSGTVAMWETGASEPDHETILRLAELFGVSTDYLLGLKDEP